MFKKFICVTLLLIVSVAISGCTTKTAPNGTFGEKIFSEDSIYLSNNTTSGTYNGTDGVEYYYIRGYLVNNNSNDALNVKIIATAYDTQGNVIATNDTPHLTPPSIPAKGVSRIYIDFPDTSHNIIKYDLKINASGNLI
jgi:hypothetical protein